MFPETYRDMIRADIKRERFQRQFGRPTIRSETIFLAIVLIIMLSILVFLHFL
jgi:hypothetical protein